MGGIIGSQNVTTFVLIFAITYNFIVLELAQCAAVSMYLLEIKDPPQPNSNFPFSAINFKA